MELPGRQGREGNRMGSEEGEQAMQQGEGVAMSSTGRREGDLQLVSHGGSVNSKD